MLDEVLDELAGRLPGFRGGALVGMDGVPLVRKGLPGGPDIDLCAAEYTAVLRQIGSLPSHEGAGSLRGLMSLLDDYSLLVERVTGEYFLILALDAAVPPGRGRHELRRAALLLEPELR